MTVRKPPVRTGDDSSIYLARTISFPANHRNVVDIRYYGGYIYILSYVEENPGMVAVSKIASSSSGYVTPSIQILTSFGNPKRLYVSEDGTYLYVFGSPNTIYDNLAIISTSNLNVLWRNQVPALKEFSFYSGKAIGVSDRGAGSSFSYIRIWDIDPTTHHPINQAVGQIPGTYKIRSMAIGSDTGYVYLTCSSDSASGDDRYRFYSVSISDRSTTYSNIPGGLVFDKSIYRAYNQSLYGVVRDPGTDKFYNPHCGRLSVNSPNEGIIETSSMALAHNLADFVLDSKFNYEYFIPYVSINVTRMSGDFSYWDSNTVGSSLYGGKTAIDPDSQLLFIASYGPAPSGLGEIYIVSIHPPEAPPSNLTVTCGALSGNIELEWTNENILEAERHTEIERSDNSGETWNSVGTANSGETSFIDNTAEPGIVYQYRAREALSTGFGSYSNVAIIDCDWNPEGPPPPPGGGTYDPIGNASGPRYTLEKPHTVTIKWDYRSTGFCGQALVLVEGFKIFRKKQGDTSYTQVGDIGSTIRQFIDNTIDKNYSYYYYIVAYNSQRNSDPSAIFMVDTSPLRIPDALTLTALLVTGAYIKMSWNYVAGLSGFYIERRNSTCNGSWIRIANVSNGATTTYIDTNIKLISSSIRLTDLEYRISAYNGYGVGDYSNTLNIANDYVL